jgi:hypothetical protein
MKRELDLPEETQIDEPRLDRRRVVLGAEQCPPTR